MLNTGTLRFLRQLAANNNKPWLDAHRADYETARADFEQLVTRILEKMTPLEPALGTQRAKDCMFRIYRDVRFSKDKTPYKAHFSAYFSKGGRKYPGAGYYLHIEPGKSFVAGGMWMPEAPLLRAVRQEIDYNLEEFEGIIKNKPFAQYFKKLSGDTLKTLPKGYTADNPAIEYLKMKSFIAEHPFADKEVLDKDFLKKYLRIVTAMQPLVDFLNRGLD
jgi:uncharacterized protein (TIGR02453 family)